MAVGLKPESWASLGAVGGLKRADFAMGASPWISNRSINIRPMCLPLFFLSFLTSSLEVAKQNSIKLCHIGSQPDLNKWRPKFGGFQLSKRWAQNRLFSVGFSIYQISANIFGNKLAR